MTDKIIELFETIDADVNECIKCGCDDFKVLTGKEERGLILAIMCKECGETTIFDNLI